MAKRKYKRDSSGRFAGGGGGGSTAAKGATAKPKAAVAGQKKVAKKGPASTRRQKVIKFVAKHPRGVVLTAYGAAVGVNMVRHRSELAPIKDAVNSAKAFKAATKYAQKVASDRRGIGSNRPGQGLKMAKKRHGAYKIRSR